MTPYSATSGPHQASPTPIYIPCWRLSVDSVTPSSYGRKNGEFVEREEEELQPGNYYIATNGSFTLTEEVPLRHTASMQSGIRVASFCQTVRRRDGRCVISGRPVRLGRWFGFEAAHIFPLAYEEHRNNFGYGNLITIPPARESDGSINSAQNGILLSCEMHCFFDNYQVAINPNDN
ncbi:hypothetical protein HOY82DRAFT_622775 [Tuber indicum]|nr:hypothetical protein HOY82DRAFT_622775 [Tuber indicum]